LKKRWPQRWTDFWNHYLVLTPEEKKVIAFVCAAFLLGLTTKIYREKHPQLVPSVERAAAQSITPTPRPKRSRKPRASATPASNER
jgi:hypothetical protein